MLKIEGAVPCSICGEHPILQGGVASHRARLVCPNYKSETMPHGNLSCETQHLPRGFTSWQCEDWWTEDQAKNNGVAKLVNVWNQIHQKKE